MPTQRNELALLREAAAVASIRLIPEVSDGEIHVVLRVLAERVNEWLDSAASASIATAAADERLEGIEIRMVGERVLRYRHYTLWVGGEKLAHWVRRVDGIRD
jgi:hypothetical protein